MSDTRLARWLALVVASAGLVLSVCAGAQASVQHIYRYGSPSTSTTAVAKVDPAAAFDAGSPSELSGAAPVAARFSLATEDGMAGVRAAGSAGEDAAGIMKNTDHIPSLSGTAAYRIPDELNCTTLGEVKNVSS